MAQMEAGGHRQALRRLRVVMAGEGSAQERLDEIVEIVAAELDAEVCSVYVARAGELLELFATKGLNPEAVHRTRLRVGEGLVGTVAAQALPLNLPDAQAHPQFSYRPETGEEIYRSLLGVPILRGGRVRGVLVVQNRARRLYGDEEVEALELIGVVVAELIAGGALISPAEAVPSQGNAVLSVRLDGIGISRGLAMGEAVLHTPRVSIPQMFADDPEIERERLAQAMRAMHSELDDMLALAGLEHSGEHRDVLAAHRRFAEDRGWLRRIGEAIDGGLAAEAAVQKVLDDTRARMRQILDPYLGERLADLEDLAYRLLRHLTGRLRGADRGDLPEEMVLVARTIGPAELLDYDRGRLKALILEEGSAASHVAIVARALDIPAIGGVRGLSTQIDQTDPVIVDGDHAQVYVRPGEDVRQMAAAHMALRARRLAEYAAMRGAPALTRDGVRVRLEMNAGPPMDLQALEASGAEGIGLFRTEIPFMVQSGFPDVAAQTELYRRVLEAANGRPVTFRTLDVGGDKQLPYFRDSTDRNPAMGWRSIRVALDRPLMLRQQLRALVAACGAAGLNVMFPMVAEVAEFDAARRMLDMELARARARGGPVPDPVRIGVMVEVPSLTWQLPALLDRVDFVSVGSNDLFQFLFAADRVNPRVADRYDALSPGPLSLLRGLAAQCGARGVPVSLCGEMAGRPIEAMALIAVGFRSLSAPAGTIGAVKKMILSLDAAALSRFVETLLDLPDRSLRARLRNFARDRGTVLEDP